LSVFHIIFIIFFGVVVLYPFPNWSTGQQ
jgi:hypothetical protein